MKKIVITGISGFIGSNLAKYLSKFSYEIIGIDKVNWDYTERDFPIIPTFYKQNINDPLPNIKDIDAVIHLAAKAGVRESQEKFKDYIEDNILGTKSLLDKCIEWKPKHILVASSSSVFGNAGNSRDPRSLYAVSKITTEEIFKSYIKNGLIDNKTNCNIIIPYTVYGPKQRKGLAIRNFIDAILNDKPITIYGDGTQTRDFTYIDDVCRSIYESIHMPDLSLEQHMGSNRDYSINEIVAKIANITNKQVTIDYKPMSRFDVMHTLAPYQCIDEITPIDVGLKKQIDDTRNAS